MLPEQVGEGFIRQFLNRCHSVAPKLLQLVEGIVVEGDQFAHPCLFPARWKLDVVKRGRGHWFPEVHGVAGPVALRAPHLSTR